MTRSALICSEVVVIPTLLEKWAVEAIEIVYENIQKAIESQKYLDKQIQHIHLLPTFFEERLVVLKAYLDALKKDYPEYVTDTVIHKSVGISKTYSTPGAALDVKSRAHAEYSSLVAEIIGEDNGKV